MYGTAAWGGDYGEGTVFKLIPPASAGGAWAFRMIYSFTGGADGANPIGNLVFHHQALYGTTSGGGQCSFSVTGCGVAFELSLASGGGIAYSVLHTFAGGSDGIEPVASVTFDTVGNIYGTTLIGGGATGCGDTGQEVTGCGTIYQLMPPMGSGGAWAENILYTFGGGSNGPQGTGAYPAGYVIFDKAGSLYGVAGWGLFADGVVFELSPPSAPGSAWIESVLYSFKAGKFDGGEPEGGLVFDASGNLYGATAQGGMTTVSCNDGCGTIFKLVPPSAPRGVWIERLLHKFGSGTDGINPSGSLMMDSTGALYGTTAVGGDSTVDCIWKGGCGTLFTLARPATAGGTWNETILYNFDGNSDGAVPNPGLVFDSTGTIYGSTSWGGSPCEYPGCGTVFQLTQ